MSSIFALEVFATIVVTEAKVENVVGVKPLEDATATEVDVKFTTGCKVVVVEF